MQPLNIKTDFFIEELEPRVEMQMLGFGADPSVVRRADGSLIIVPVVDELGSVVGYT